MVSSIDRHLDSLEGRNCFHVTLTIVDDTYRVQATKTLVTRGVLPFRSPHVGALHVVLVGSRPEHLGSDLIQIEERIRIGSIVCGNFGGASLAAIQTRKKLASLTAVTSAPEGSDASASTAHIFTGPQLEVRSLICLNWDFELAFFKLVAGMEECFVRI